MQQLVQVVHEAFATLGRNGRKANRRHAEDFFELVQVHMDTAARRNVHHVHRQDHRHALFHQLAREEQVAFQVRRIQNVHDQVRLALEQVIESGTFVFGIREKRVDARQVHHANRVVVELKLAFLLFDSHARPVAHNLVRAGQRVEERRLSAVRVARNRNRENFFLDRH